MSKSKSVPSFLMTPPQLEHERAEFIKHRVFDLDCSMFGNPYGAGYWLHGVDYDNERGWLAFNFEEGASYRQKSQHADAILAWKAGHGVSPQPPLPPNYYCITHDTARKLFDAAIQKWGEDGLREMDLPRMDVLLQWVLLGEIKYG